MKQGIYKVVKNEQLTESVYRMVLEGDTSDLLKPGQFVNLTVEGCYLRRPISVYDWDENTVTIIYKVVGEGTEKMSQWQEGLECDVLTGLGNGFTITESGDKPLLIGGGVGIPPMYGLCKRLIAQGKKPTVILGFNKSDEIFCKEEFEKIGAETIVTTVDGSFGVKGFVTDAMKELEYTYFYTCGPMPMFKAIEKTAVGSGEYSFEERMGCGFGACMGCSCKTKYGNKRICKDGPVLKREEIIW
ncbi:MAG: dihydroorotate dehydrogenase electron transfer subunit [Acutalibacteraceae bacterium]|nr:dihydroorotate dehydrogenase electron transfer subunit [Acutalibacteraceae bacterium]